MLFRVKSGRFEEKNLEISLEPPSGVRAAGAALCRWRALSWSWTAAAATLLDDVRASLRAARLRVLSCSWTAAAATLLDEVRASFRAARGRSRSCSWTAAGVRGARAGLLLLLPCWTA